MTIAAYPLCWPERRPRSRFRERGRFRATFARARDNIVREVRMLGGSELIVSTNIETKHDGLPYATFKTPDDAGVAVYFTYKKRQMCFACDRYHKAEDNMHAISLTIVALRGIARWGTGDMMEAAFTGFTALPAPGQTSANWRAVLGLSGTITAHEVDAAYRKLRSHHHPDKGGDSAAFHAVQTAYDQAKREFNP